MGHPVPDRRRIPFTGLRRRPLETPAQSAKDSPDMTRVIGHARASLDHRRDPRERPEICRKPLRAGTLAQRLIHARQLRRREFRLAPGSPCPAQGGAPSPAPGLKPAAYTLPAHPQGTGDLGHDLAGCKQARCPTAAQFQGMEVSAWGYMSVHAPIINDGAGNVTLFCEIH